MRSYKCLSQQRFGTDNYKLIPIRDEDRYQIMLWRNEQIEILRQKNLLTKEDQDLYFREVVSKLFEDANPSQLLFSFLENDRLIGYGGLVHIDWESKNGEVSFITETSRNQEAQQFKSDWSQYLKILRVIAAIHLRFNKIYTYAYDIRPWLFPTLLENDFVQEATLKDHIFINGHLHHVLIHSHFCKSISLKAATEQDLLLYFHWANEKAVRANSFDQNPISMETHSAWFSKQIKDPNCIMLVAYYNNEAIGQIRFDQTDKNVYEIDFSVAASFRGLGIGTELMKLGVNDFMKRRPDFLRITARVKKENTPSRQVFIKAGFQLHTAQHNASDLYYLDNKT